MLLLYSGFEGVLLFNFLNERLTKEQSVFKSGPDWAVKVVSIESRVCLLEAGAVFPSNGDSLSFMA